LVIPKASFLSVSDNSGARSLKILSIYAGRRDKGAYLPGELLFVLIKKAVPHKKVKRGDKQKAVLLQSRLSYKRSAGFVRCSSNLAVVLKKTELLPVANRIYVKTLLEMRGKGFFRISLISRGVV